MSTLRMVAVGLCLINLSLAQPSENERQIVWRCSLDQKLYRIQVMNDSVSIAPVEQGTLAAYLRIKTDKKGRQNILGQWQAGLLQGFIQIQQATDQMVIANLLVPAEGAAPNSCVSRTAAVFSAMGRGQVACVPVTIRWDRQEALAAEAALAAGAVVTENAPVTASPAASDANEFLIGTWMFKAASAVYYQHIEITLSADGRYTKTLKARTPGAGGGGVVGGPTLGGTHSGTWTANGMFVELSGDGNWPPATHDLNTFVKLW